MSTPIRPELPGNSDGQKKDVPERAPMQAIVKPGGARKRDTPVIKRLGKTFINEDLDDVKNYVLWDVVIPATKNLISDMISSATNGLLFGEMNGRRVNPNRSGGNYRVVDGRNGYTSYNRAYPQRPESVQRNMSKGARARHDFGEIVFNNREETFDVLEKLRDSVEMYGSATVGDMYSLAGISSDPVDEKWGWTDLTNAGVSRVRNGYILTLPQPDYIR